MAKMILNIRPVADSWRDAATMSRRGVQSACIPLMEILELAPQLPNSQEICGLVFTSRHAVSAFVDEIGAGNWRRIPVFVVGHATAAVALDASASDRAARDLESVRDNGFR